MRVLARGVVAGLLAATAALSAPAVASAVEINFEKPPLADGTTVSTQFAEQGVSFESGLSAAGATLPVMRTGDARSKFHALDISPEGFEFPIPRLAGRFESAQRSLTVQARNLTGDTIVEMRLELLDASDRIVGSDTQAVSSAAGYVRLSATSAAVDVLRFRLLPVTASAGGGHELRVDDLSFTGASLAGEPPVAAFVPDRAEPLENRPFNAVSTATDVDGSIAQWHWELGTGDAFDDASGPRFALRLPAGKHVIGLKVVDDDGLTDVARQTVSVSSTAPFFPLQALELFTERPMFIPDRSAPPRGRALDAGNQAPKLAIRIRPRRPRAGRLVTLDASRSRDESRLASFEWDLDDDGEADDGRGARVRTTFAKAGKARIALVARDDKGLANRKSAILRVHGTTPNYRGALAGALAGAPVRRLAGSFERGLSGWRRVGTAFPARPSRLRTLPAAVELRTASRLGGSYARAGVSIGAAGRGWMSSTRAPAGTRGLTRDARPQLATGALVSPAFKVDRRYLTMRIGGDDHRRGKTSLERVEVWVSRGGVRRRVAAVAAGESEQLRTETIDLRRHRGAIATVVAIDASSSGHLNLDTVRTARRPAPPAPLPPVVGFADTHTHPMAHQSFGGLRGHRTYMGVPGGRYADYLAGGFGADRYGNDVKDLRSHSAGTRALRGAFELVHNIAPDLAAGLHEQMHITEIRRAWEGGLRLMSSLAVSNEALEHVTGRIVDRETGGDPCVDFGGLCERDGRVRATIPTTRDRQIIEAHVLGMRQLARLNSDWMRIVYHPREAYEVMRDGKLAVVLGSEVDGLGRLGFASPEQEVDWLWRLGLRQIQPVHAVDNPLGSPAAFQDLYNTTNDLVNRPERDARRDRIADEVRENGLRLTNPRARFGAFLRVENWGCHFATRNVILPPGECIDWRYGDSQAILGLDTNIGTGPHPMFASSGARPAYGGGLREDGQRTRSGLTAEGLRYARALMRRGMLIDIEHMSDRGIDALLASGTIPGEPRGPVWDALAPNRPGCEPGNALRPRSVRPGCYDDAYPVMSSHTSFRGQSLAASPNHALGPRGAGVTRSLVKGFWAREFERTPRQIEYIREAGGTIAPVVGHDPVLRPQTTTRTARGAPATAVFRGEDHALRTDPQAPALNDCAGSSKSWITAYLYGVQKMGGRGVGLSTDMAVVGSTGPRFNPSNANPLLPKNCPSSYANFNPRFNLFDLANPSAALDREIARSRDAEQRGYPWQYNRNQDTRTRVSYYDPRGSAAPVDYLRRHRTPTGRVYDFNTDGIKTYGALPDLLQDAVNVGVDHEDLRPLLRSAQNYVDMWTKAFRLAGCDAAPRTSEVYRRCGGTGPAAIDNPEAVCANTCPDSPGRGHALLPDGRPLFR